MKKLIKKATRNFPAVQGILRNAFKRTQRLGNRLTRVGTNSDRASKPAYYLTMPLGRIVYCNQEAGKPGSTPRLNTIPGESIIADGEWDQLRLPLEEMPLYQSIKAYLFDGKDLRDTPIYAGEAINPAQITSGSWHAVYEQNLEDKKAKIDFIYRSLKEQGYRSQAELGSNRPHDEITVRIARDGQVLLENSIHRTIIARLIGIEAVPVVVSVRHSGWLSIRDRFLDFARNRESGCMYGKLSHPDLGDIPHAHPLDDRVALIARHMRNDAGYALDLGCDTGFFSQFLSHAGYHVYAVERDPELADIAQLMSSIEGHGVHFIVGDILDDEAVRQYQRHKYSVVLALNILHHFLKKQERVEKLRHILRNLQMEQLFLQCHRQDEPQMQTAYMNPSPDGFAQFIIENSCLSRFQHIGVGADGRTMLLLS